MAATSTKGIGRKKRARSSAISGIDKQFLAEAERASRGLVEHRLRDKCHGAEVTLTPEQEKALLDFVQNGTVGRWFDELPVQVCFTQADWDAVNQQLSQQIARVPSIVESIVTDIAKTLLRSIRSDWRKRKYDADAEILAFRTRLKNRWEEAFDELKLLVTLCSEIGNEELQRLRRSKAKSGILRRDTLIRLHSRACLISGEIMVLLESGYADGAMARWRTIHEIFVIASLIGLGDDDLAQRYRFHEAVDTKKAMDLYFRDHEQLGYPAPTSDDLEEVTAQYNAAIRLYGDGFANPFGWASNFLNQKNPRFYDLQKAVGREDMSSSYKMASYPIHADYKGLSWQLGTLGRNDILLAGPSNAGLEEPGQNLALSLVAITSLLETDVSLDAATPLAALCLQRDKAIKALNLAGQRLSADATKRGTLVMS